MFAKLSPTMMVFGGVNILMAIALPCAGFMGVTFFMNQPVLLLKGRDVGPQFRQHMERELPAARYEAFGAAACDSLVALLLIAGGIGLILGHEWGRWLSVGAGVLMVLTLCIHDVYQLGVFRPALMGFLDQHLPPGPDREPFKIGFAGTFFLWSWTNPLLMLYVLAMCVTLILHRFLGGQTADKPKGRGRRSDDRHEDDDR